MISCSSGKDGNYPEYTQIFASCQESNNDITFRFRLLQIINHGALTWHYGRVRPRATLLSAEKPVLADQRTSLSRHILPEGVWSYQPELIFTKVCLHLIYLAYSSLKQRATRSSVASLRVALGVFSLFLEPRETCSSISNYDILAYMHKKRDPLKKKAYRQSVPEKTSQYNRTYRLKNPDKIKNIRYCYNHSDRYYDLNSEAKKRYRARKNKSLINDLTSSLWHEIKIHFKNRCYYCKSRSAHLTQDHIIPLSRGGSHTITNIIPACRKCNSSKGISSPPIPVQPLLPWNFDHNF